MNGMGVEQGLRCGQAALQPCRRRRRDRDGVEIELRLELARPLLDEMRRAQDGEAVDLAAVDQLAQDQPGLDGLADADIVGDQQPHDRQGAAPSAAAQADRRAARSPAAPPSGTAPRRAAATAAAPRTAAARRPGSRSRPLSAARTAPAAPARVRAPDGSPARRPRRRTAGAGTASRRRATAAPPIRVRARRRDRPAQTWRSCGHPKQFDELGRRLHRPAPPAELQRRSRAPRPPRASAASTGPIDSRRQMRCARRAAGSLPFDRERLGIRRRQAPARQRRMPVAVRLALAPCRYAAATCCALSRNSIDLGIAIRAVDQLVVGLVVVGQQAAVAARDAAGVRLSRRASSGSRRPPLHRRCR